MTVQYFTTGHFCVLKKSNCLCATWDGCCSAENCPRIPKGHKLVNNWVRPQDYEPVKTLRADEYMVE